MHYQQNVRRAVTLAATPAQNLLLGVKRYF